jgi:hypothetical protein
MKPSLMMSLRMMTSPFPISLFSELTAIDMVGALCFTSLTELFSKTAYSLTRISK